MKNEMPCLERLVRMMKARNFRKYYILIPVMVCGTEEHRCELADYIEDNDIYDEESVDAWLDENIGRDEFVDGIELDDEELD